MDVGGEQVHGIDKRLQIEDMTERAWKIVSSLAHFPQRSCSWSWKWQNWINNLAYNFYPPPGFSWFSRTLPTSIPHPLKKKPIPFLYCCYWKEHRACFSTSEHILSRITLGWILTFCSVSVYLVLVHLMAVIQQNMQPRKNKQLFDGETGPALLTGLYMYNPHSGTKGKRLDGWLFI